MNRTALCIRMLQLLKTRGRMQITELAQALETNPRNVREFRRELETAGYVIRQTRGRYGGYELDGEVLLPALALQREEEQALQEAGSYLRAHPDFVHQEAFRSALEKLLSGSRDPVSSGTYVFSRLPDMSEQMRGFVERCTRAIEQQRCVRITYRTLSEEKPYTILIHPYELLYYQGACYALAYSLRAHDYRLFRFSEQRMFDFTLLERHFQRDADFALAKHIGENGLIKGELFFARFLVKGVRARLLAERRIGVSCHMRWIDVQQLQVEVWMESTYALLELLLQLGSDGKLLAPKHLKERLVCECEQMLAQYTSPDESMI